ncbi:acetyl-CoA synthetase-like protein [Coniophora puteana RWD-64-598 SS2]|uniref:Acetyl-CoA synthetase-like protein n=1 Tax=Coniophora puteana (strain RWD-64-598) TaxID=741705 RepID=A0A5M3MLH7_CONPW|nr:acetyl-CoA synthetase-like protein [Coniophora puteana RWD-64-598 SS2]EIW80018.1 acetyl-CoA synthetase-like protein [Coniophora puteana RWD-64-598 SS2]
MLARALPPAVPNTQCLSSTSFTIPPLGPGSTIAQTVEWHAAHSAQHPLFVYPREDGSQGKVTWSEVGEAVKVGATILLQRTGLDTDRTAEGRPVVGILALSDMIPYATTFLAIQRAGCTPFPISPRNSPAAVAHLLANASVAHILVGPEESMQTLLSAALDILLHPPSSSTLPSNTDTPAVLPLPTYTDLYHPSPSTLASLPALPALPTYDPAPSSITAIMHSSGSTAFPKPIPWTSRNYADLRLVPFFGERDLTGSVFALQTMPMYHGLGVVALCWAAGCGLTIGAFEPRVAHAPATVPTPDNVFAAARTIRADIVFAVPSMVEAWATRPDYVEWLASRTGVLYGGGPLNKDTGDALTAQGVNVFIFYGSTEIGVVSPILPARVGYDWEYFAIPAFIKPELVPVGDNTFELLVLANTYSVPAVFNTALSDGVKAYATSDLLSPHPTRKGYWRVFGRTDDQIMHSTGEKTNPGPLESILTQDPHVGACVMFGRGRFQPGVVVDPAPGFEFDPRDAGRAEAFRGVIWPSVEAMNRYAPQHSRVFREMIVISTPGKPFTYTAKGTVRRQAVIHAYSDEIDAAYAAAEKLESVQSGGFAVPEVWTADAALAFVRAVVWRVVGREVGDGVDLFQVGCDSLQATWIRNTLLRALQGASAGAGIDVSSITENIVYRHPTISALASFLVDVAHGDKITSNANVVSQRADRMRAMAEKYISKSAQSTSPSSHRKRCTSPLASASAARNSGHEAVGGAVVLVTGTTGMLGSQLLAALVGDPSVGRVYALNRAQARSASGPGECVRARQVRALRQAGLDVRLLESEKVVLVEGDLTEERFGMGEVYEEMRGSVTHVVHNAWTVNFNLGLDSFEGNIRGLRSLVDFVLSSSLSRSPKVVFTSSIGVVQNSGSKTAIPETAVEAEVAVGTGYSESKWVAEHILQRMAQTHGLDALVVRVGQLCGAVESGAWNVNEWVPALVQAAQVLGCFPSEDKDVSWMPISTAASVLADVALSSGTETPRSRVVHLVHPRPVAFSKIADAFAAELDVQAVSYGGWLTKLEAFASRAQDGPADEHNGQPCGNKTLRAVQLLPFFRALAATRTGSEALGFPRLECTQLERCSGLVRERGVELLGAGDVGRFSRTLVKKPAWAQMNTNEHGLHTATLSMGSRPSSHRAEMHPEYIFNLLMSDVGISHSSESDANNRTGDERVSRRIPPAPQSQALTSATFKVAPLDGSLTFPEVVDWHGVHSSDHPLFVYAKEDGSTRAITWSEVASAVSVGSRLLRQRTKVVGAGERPIVGILAISVLKASLLRANFVPFPISPRNSAMAAAHLIEQANVDFILVGREQSMQDLLDEALSVRRDKASASPALKLPTVVPLFTFDELFSPSPDVLAYLPDHTPFISSGPDADLIILHSSGSTAFPKLIRWSNIRGTQISLIPFFGDHDLTGKVFSLHTVPMYHGMGFNQLLWAAGCGLTISAFEPKVPAMQPTPDNLFVGAKRTSSDFIYCVPSVIEDWASKPDYVRWLATRSGLLFGGGPLNKETGDFMFSQGIGMYIMYAGTEMGPVGPMIPANVDKDWEFFTISKQIQTEFVPYSENTFELVIVSNDFCVPSVLNTDVNGKKAYATSDLLEPHLTKKGYWRVFGRADDQIMHSTGEKTNPGPLESILNRDPHVTASVMFGRASPAKPFTYTAKNTARRQAILNAYTDAIGAAYAAAHQSAQSSIEPPAEWSLELTSTFVSPPDSSATQWSFVLTTASLQATWIRNTVLRALRDSASTSVNTRKISESVVYQHPTINSLTAFLVEAARGNAEDAGEFSISQRVEAMHRMVEKYITGDAPTRETTSANGRLKGNGTVVLVTGTTGGLGSHILDVLVKDSRVRHVFALNRSSRAGEDIRTRQRRGFVQAGLDEGVSLDNVTLVKADLVDDHLGLRQDLYDEMLRSVTHVIHNAWNVNFNLGLDSFEDNIQATQNLVRFSLSSHLPAPPRVVFTSSIGVFQNVRHKQYLAETPIKAEVAAGLGYTESKWVAERLLMHMVGAFPGLDVLIARVGQLCGTSGNGAWNAKEWFPALVQASQAMGCFPTQDKAASWIPISAAASVLVDLTLSSSKPKDSIVHLVHPQPVIFSSLASHFASMLDVPLVTYDAWLSKLAALSDDASSIPRVQPNGDGNDYSSIRALQLLPYFRGLASNADSGDSFGLPSLDCSQLKLCSKADLSTEMESLGQADVVKWVAYWRQVGLLRQVV